MKTAYDKLLGYEKEKVDRQMEDITASTIRHQKSNEKSAWASVQAATKEVASYAYGFVLNGGHLNVPETKFLENGEEIPCSYCHKVYGAVYRKGRNWCCENCKDEVEGEIEDTFFNYKKGA